MQVWGEELERSVSSLMDLTMKTEQSWNKKAFQLYSGNWGQILSPKLRQAFNQVFRSFGTRREIGFFHPLLHTTAFLLSREKLLTQEMNHLICCRHLPQGKMNNSQKLLSLVALYLMAEGAHMTADRDVYTGQTNPTPECPDSRLADEMLKEE